MLVTLTTPCAFWAHEAFRQDNPRIVPVSRLPLQGELGTGPDAQLVQVRQQIGRILIDPVGARLLQLLPPIAP